MRPTSLTFPWLQPLIREWEIQIEIGGGCMALALDEFLQDADRCAYVLLASGDALERTSESSKRTGQLFLALLRGDVKTDASSPIDYL